MSPGKNTAVVGRLSSQPCWRIAWKKAPGAVMASSFAPWPSGLGGQPGQVAFQQGPVDAGERVDLRGGLGQERG